MLSRAIVSFVLGATPPALAAPVRETFGDWDVVCDNVGDCAAYEFSESDQGVRDFDIWLKVSIEADPRLTGRAKSVDFAEAEIIGAPAAPAGEAPVEQLPAMARTHDEATVASAKAQATISLSGLAATLIAIDEAQGRLGTRVTLIARATSRFRRFPDRGRFRS